MRKIYLPAKQFKTLFIFFSFLLFAFWANAQTTYYLSAVGQGSAQTLTSWRVNINGTGASPASFTNGTDIFIIPVGISGIFGASTAFGSAASSGSGVAIQVIGTLTINTGVTILLNGKNANQSSISITGTIIFGATSKVSLNDNDARMFFTLSA